MERETGIEPATNSLEDCESIANKSLRRSWRAILAIDTIEFMQFTLQAAQTQ